MKAQNIISWILRLFIALFFLQTLFFKFSGAEVSIYIFSQLHAEPWGRFLSGFLEFTSAILLLLPRKKFIFLGSLLASFLMLGALLSHLFILGISFTYPNGYEDGSLFLVAVLIFISSLVLLYFNKGQIKQFVKKYIN